jgi:hypothetical protein
VKAVEIASKIENGHEADPILSEKTPPLRMMARNDGERNY